MLAAEEMTFESFYECLGELKSTVRQEGCSMSHLLQLSNTSKQARTIKVSKVTKRHCAGTVQSQGGRV